MAPAAVPPPAGRRAAPALRHRPPPHPRRWSRRSPAAEPRGRSAPRLRDLLQRVRSGLALGKHYNSRIDTRSRLLRPQPAAMWNACSNAPRRICTTSCTRWRPAACRMELALLPIIESAFQPYAYSQRQRLGAVAVHRLHRQPLQPEAGLVVRRPPRRGRGHRRRTRLPHLPARHCWMATGCNAIAAYNCGEGNVPARHPQATRPPASSHRLLEPEAARRNARLCAAPAGHQRASWPTRRSYGLTIEGIPTALLRKVETGGQISIEVAAELAGITTEDMYELNPAHHRWATDPSGPYILLVPVESAADTSAPTCCSSPRPAPACGAATPCATGDTVTSIAGAFGTTSQHLQELNSLGNATKLAVESELRVPSAVKALPQKVRTRGRPRGLARAWWRACGACGQARRNPVRHRQAPQHGPEHAGEDQRHQHQLDAAGRPAAAPHAPRPAAATVHPSAVAWSAATPVPAAARSPMWSVAATRCPALPDSLKVTVSSLREWNKLSGSRHPGGPAAQSPT